MIIIKHPGLLKEFIARERAAGKAIGFVPTMGALHAGHLDLVRISGLQCATTVCSIFVNPTQFNDPADFKKYPQTIDKDIRLLERSAADVLFLPAVADLYPAGTASLEEYDLGYLENILEGKFRPGHFQGVCQVMSRLLDMVRPDALFMGQKDYQQCMVVGRLLELMRLGTRLEKCATVRETDGLAMSSRNLRLSPDQRAIAPVIYKTLKEAGEKTRSADFPAIRQWAMKALEESGLRPEYVEIADASTLAPVQSHDASQTLVILAAAFLGEVRLIDNIIV